MSHSNAVTHTFSRLHIWSRLHNTSQSSVGDSLSWVLLLLNIVSCYGLYLCCDNWITIALCESIFQRLYTMKLSERPNLIKFSDVKFDTRREWSITCAQQVSEFTFGVGPVFHRITHTHSVSCLRVSDWLMARICIVEFRWVAMVVNRRKQKVPN